MLTLIILAYEIDLEPGCLGIAENQNLNASLDGLGEHVLAIQKSTCKRYHRIIVLPLYSGGRQHGRFCWGHLSRDGHLRDSHSQVFLEGGLLLCWRHEGTSKSSETVYRLWSSQPRCCAEEDLLTSTSWLQAVDLSPSECWYQWRPASPQRWPQSICRWHDVRAESASRLILVRPADNGVQKLLLEKQPEVLYGCSCRGVEISWQYRPWYLNEFFKLKIHTKNNNEIDTK